MNTSETQSGDSLKPVGSVKSIAAKLGVMLVKHGVIDPASLLDPKGYDNYDTVEKIRAVAQEWHDTLPPNDQ